MKMKQLPPITGPNQVIVKADELASLLEVKRRTIGNWDATGFITGLRQPGTQGRKGKKFLRYDLWEVLQALKGNAA